MVLFVISKEELKKIVDSREYEIPFFKEFGFVRNQCKVCGEYFWTLDTERETCGDPECEGEYRFPGIIRDPTWNLERTIKEWVSFFEKHGFKYISPAPVVARWRDDLEFTIASIAVFQPWVVKGIVEPPANPLVIPQPCIRFGGAWSDIDAIGRTARHLTTFYMGGEHAFNYPDKQVFWKDEYIRTNFEFLTKVLKIPKEELTYKEDTWMGGGNWGPSIESFAFGLEIVNGVFMQYEFTDSGYQPLKIKVLDVGWGLERISWFMQGTPTIYEATFGPVFSWLIKQVGVKVDRNLLIKYAKFSVVDPKTPERFRETRTRLAQRLGMDMREFMDTFGEIEAIYAILDHTRTVAYAVCDGALPANVGGCYNLRMILRRALSLAEAYKFNIDWEELLSKQIEYFSRIYPRLNEARDVIIDVWKVEMRRYKNTIERGIAEIKKILKKKRLKRIGYEILRDLYISHGIPPESVKEVASKFNVEVEIPPNFYDLIRLEKISQMGEKKEETPEERARKILGDIIDKLPETIPLYYKDQYAREFRGKVLLAKGKYIILDKTVFYPTGGGQHSDTGVLIIDGRRYDVINVFKLGNIIIHEVKQNVDANIQGKEAYGKIDWERRIGMMRHHTATHIINAAARIVLGPHIWQVGADKTPERARLDISHYKPLTMEEIRKIEELANRIVLENRPIIIEELSRTEAEKKYSYRIYQGGAVPSGKLRIVYIYDWDAEACGGTHLKSTGEVGLIKIIRTKRIHDGVVRLVFVAGMAAYKYITEMEKWLRDSCAVVRVTPEDLPKTVERFFDEWKAQQEAIRNLSKTILQFVPELVKSEVYEIDGEKIIIARIDVPQEYLIRAAINVRKKLNMPCILASSILGKNALIACVPDNLKKRMKQLLSSVNIAFSETKWGLIASPAMDATSLLRMIIKKLSARKIKAW